MGVAAVTGVVSLTLTTVAGQAPTPSAKAPAAAKAGPAPKTEWGEPDLQGIWRDDYQTPLQRPAKYANKELFSDAERAALDQERAAFERREIRKERGSERDVAGAYNSVFIAFKHTGKRTSMIVDPPDGRIPPVTPEAQKLAAADREFQLALMQATQTCKNQDAPTCAGGKYDPKPSPRWTELPPRYNVGRLNRHFGAEDGSLGDRCMSAILPDFGAVVGGYTRIVQTPGGISLFYDTGQGQGWQRNVVMNGSSHLPSNIRQWWGDSVGHWEGNTLVVDVTNFTPKTSYQGSRENLHLIERYTRVDANTLELAVTVEDPTTWTRPWTVKQELRKQSDQANRMYYEPRCHEGNYGFPAMLLGARLDEAAFAEGRGPEPASKDTATCFGGEDDPVQ
jgi:hypothetical protein